MSHSLPGHHDHRGHAHGGSHGHGDDHAHVPAVTGANERKVLLSFVLIFGFMLVEVAGGLMSGSLALLADAGHMLTDAVALALAYAAFRVGRRAADSRRTFGYLRLEVIAGFLNAVTLFAIVGWIGVEAWRRFLDPTEILAGPMMAVAVVGLLVNVVVLWIMTRGDTDHVNVRGAILHVVGDLLGSVAAIVAALVVMLTGWTPIDPILSIFVALLILRSAWALLARSLHILLEGAPDDASPDMVVDVLMQGVPGLAEAHHVHVWQLTSGRTMATLHVRADRDDLAPGVVREVDRVLRERFGIEHSTIEIDWNSEGDPLACSLQPQAERDASNGHGRDPARGHDLDRGRRDAGRPQ